MRVVLDTNILLTSFSSRSETHWIWRALLEGKFTWCITNDILLEYEEIISRHMSPELAGAVSGVLLDLPNVHFILRYYSWNLITVDPDDNKFTDCVVTAQAKFLVSEDRHFYVLKNIPFPKIEVISIDDFKREMDALIK